MLRLARITWVVVCLLGVVTLIVSLPFLLRALQTVCEGCQAPFLSPQDLQELQAMGLSIGFWIIYQLIFIFLPMLVGVAVGLVIFVRRSDDPVAILFSGVLIVVGIAGQSYPTDALIAAWPVWWLPAKILEYLASIGIFVMVYLFPNGHWVPRWTRWFALIWMAIMFPATFMRGSSLDFTTWPQWLLFPLIAIMFLSLPLAQGYRYLRRSTLIERQQTKWVLYGIFSFAGIMLIFSILVLIFPALVDNEALSWGYFFAGIVLVFAWIVIPVSIGIAILRYRLFDIDVIIRRTLVYAALTTTLALVYFSSVVLLQSLFTAVSGQQSAVAVVISTLLIAALFSPLRRRIQNDIDRRFFRQKYDTEKVVAAFGASLREKVDLDDLQAQIVSVVVETMQPESVSLWLRTVKNTPSASNKFDA